VVAAASVSPTRAYEPRSAATDWANRLTRCFVGLALFGGGDGLIIRAELGFAPWDMLHKGVSNKLDISVGVISIITGVFVLLLWIPLRQRPGIGTIMNALEIGVMIDVVLAVVPDTDRLVGRAAYLVGGLLLIALGSGLYIGAGLGTGPRDGVMVGLSKRGISIRLARTAIEVTVGVAGIILGVWPGIGTLVFMFGIGPLVQLFLPRMSLPPRRRIDRG
jgi:uncharacterized membrane protein YczE